MRNIRFKAERLGGLLKPEEHILLMQWAIKCVEHICPLLHIEISDQIKALNELKAMAATYGFDISKPATN